MSSADIVSTGFPGSESRATKIHYQSSSEGVEFSIQYQVGQQTVQKGHDSEKVFLNVHPVRQGDKSCLV